MTPGSTLNEVGSVSLDGLSASFVPGETYDLKITMTGGTTYGFQVAAVFSDETQAGALAAVTDETVGDEVREVQILTQTSPLDDGSVDFKWTAPLVLKEEAVILKVASNSSNANSAPTGDAIHTLQELVPQEQKLHFAQLANGDGWVSRIRFLTPGTEKSEK